MKVWHMIATALLASVLASLGSIALLAVREHHPAISIAYFVVVGERNLGFIGWIFVVAFAVSSIPIFLIAVGTDLTRVHDRLTVGALFEASPRNPIYATFIGTSAAAVAQRLDAALVEIIEPRPASNYYLPLHLLRSIRLEIGLVYVKRFIAFQMATLGLYAIYLSFFQPLAPTILTDFFPWSVPLAGVAIAILGGWLWIEDRIEGIAADFTGFYRRISNSDHGTGGVDVDHLSNRLPTDISIFSEALDSAFTRYQDRVEIVIERLCQRFAEVILAHTGRENWDETHDNKIDVELSGHLGDFKQSLGELTDRVVPLLARLSSDQDKLYAAVRKQDAELSSLNRANGQVNAKLGTIEVALGRLAHASPEEQQKPVQQDAQGKAVSGALAKSLEQLLSELGTPSSNDKSAE